MIDPLASVATPTLDRPSSILIDSSLAARTTPNEDPIIPPLVMADSLGAASPASAEQPAHESSSILIGSSLAACTPANEDSVIPALVMTDPLEAASPASAAQPAHESPILNLNERRIANDGEAYTFQEFATHYGFESGLAAWQKSKCLDSAEQPVHITASPPEDNAEQPVHITASLPEDSAAQPVSTTASHTERHHIHLSWDELVAMTAGKGGGGKAANAEQKRLRAHCFDNGLWEVDLSNSTYDWKQLLKAMPQAKSQPLVGAGVVKFSFRLLQNVRDHNYIKIDSGERHVFEIVCADGERWQLHFHKNGTMDNPVRIPPQAVLHGLSMNTTSDSAARPVHEEGPIWSFRDILDSPSQENLPVGRNEVRMALATILQSYSAQQAPFAVDITATTVFPWHRWLRNVVYNQELIGSGIVKVFAHVPSAVTSDTVEVMEAEIVFCHPDGTYTCAKPGKRLEYQQLNGWRAR